MVHPVFGRAHNVRTIYSLRGDIDGEAVPPLRRDLMKFAATTTGDVVIDCHDLEAIDPSGAALLLEFHHDLVEFGRRVTLRRIPADCRESLEASHLSELLGDLAPLRRRSPR